MALAYKSKNCYLSSHTNFIHSSTDVFYNLLWRPLGCLMVPSSWRVPIDQERAVGKQHQRPRLLPAALNRVCVGAWALQVGELQVLCGGGGVLFQWFSTSPYSTCIFYIVWEIVNLRGLAGQKTWWNKPRYRKWNVTVWKGCSKPCTVCGGGQNLCGTTRSSQMYTDGISLD